MSVLIFAYNANWCHSLILQWFTTFLQCSRLFIGLSELNINTTVEGRDFSMKFIRNFWYFVKCCSIKRPVIQIEIKKCRYDENLGICGTECKEVFVVGTSRFWGLIPEIKSYVLLPIEVYAKSNFITPLTLPHLAHLFYASPAP